jgi:ATP-dependent RNA helicase DDX52/ROK1
MACYVTDSIANVMRESGCEVPEWMLRLPKPRRLERKLLEKQPVHRRPIDTTPSYDKKKILHRK